ncbi:MAG: flagellar basal body L-ring protein FlgH [Pirellulales bacterium]
MSKRANLVPTLCVKLVPTLCVGTQWPAARAASKATERDAERRRRAFPRGAWERVAWVLAAVVLLCDQAVAQDSSLLTAPAPPAKSPQAVLTLDNSSFIFRKLPPEAEHRELVLHDIITVLVDYRSSMLSEGDANNKRTASLNAVLSDWLKFTGTNLIPSPQSNGDQRVNGSLQSQFKAESDMTLKDTLTFKIAAEIIDIQPNGNLVIEARNEFHINEEVWQHSLTGVVRRQSIGRDRTVRSDEVFALRLDKRNMGFVKDGYARGWFTRWYDTWKPF